MGWVRPLGLSDNSLWVSVAEEEGQGPEVQGIPMAGSVSPLLQEKQSGIVQKKEKQVFCVPLWDAARCSDMDCHQQLDSLLPSPVEEGLSSAAAAVSTSVSMEMPTSVP